MIKKETSRLEYLDLVKGIGIFFVVWGHAECPIKGWIYSFHMPLFFIISGLFFSNKADFRSFVMKKAKQLLFPFVTFNIIGVLTHILVYLLVEQKSLLDFSFREEIGLGYIKGELYFPNRVTWFLWSLFFIFVCIYVLTKLLKSKTWALLFTSIVLYGISFLLVQIGIKLPYFLNSMMCGQLYFTIGYIGKDWILKAVQSQKYLWLTLIALVYAVSYYYFPTNIDIIIGEFNGNPLIHILQCLTVLYLISVVCFHIRRLPFFNFWGVNSLYMLGLNLPLLAVIDFVYFEIVPKNYLTSFFGVILIFFLAFPIYWLLSRYFPVSLGKEKTK